MILKHKSLKLRMEIRAKIKCSDGIVYGSYLELREIPFFQRLLKNGTTKVSEEESDVAMTYKIPTYKIPIMNLDCSVEMFNFLQFKHKYITYKGDSLASVTTKYESKRSPVDKCWDLPIIETLYYIGLYGVFPVWSYMGDEILCANNIHQMDLFLIEYLAQELKGINILEFLSHSYCPGSLIPYCYKISTEGKLSIRVINDLIEYIPQFINSLYRPQILIGERDCHISHVLDLIDWYEGDKLNGLTYCVSIDFEYQILNTTPDFLELILSRPQNPKYEFLIKGLVSHLTK